MWSALLDRIPLPAAMYRLQCPVQTYAWGKVGMTSTVAQLKGGEVSDTTPYAEYW